VVGISNYVFLGKIPPCGSDARAIATALCRARRMNPDHIALMTGSRSEDSLNPSKQLIIERIKSVVAEAKPGGLAFVYFSGHGVMHNGKLLLVPKDCKSEDGIPLLSIVAMLAKSKASEKLVIVDACHASAEQKGVDGINPDLAKTGGKVAVFFSCNRGEFSYLTKDTSQSAYTHVFVRALKDLSRDGRRVTARGLQTRIEELMRSWRLKEAKPQNPRLILPAATDVILVPGRK
jgi:hypothetical protein